MKLLMEKKNPVYFHSILLIIIFICISWIPTLFGATDPIITYVISPNLGEIAVRIEVPDTPRYPEGAPIVVEVSTWFVAYAGFHRVNDTGRIGAVTISYLWPDRVDPETGARSEGTYDFGGPTSLEALRDVIRFAGGLIPDVQGRKIDELFEIPIILENVGLFASSHAGVVGTNVLAHHGSEMPFVKYFVGRENPTRDEMYPLELGYFDDQRRPIHNPFYDENDYSPKELTVDYSSVGWYTPEDGGKARPYFAATADHAEHILHETISPKMWGKRYYSRAITQALLDNGALTLENWPLDLATPAETHDAWPFRTTVYNYPDIGTDLPHLKVMLVFSRDDHVQAARTKPHIHQAYDGFHKGADLWVRMNPDRSYVQSLDPGYGIAFPDNDAVTEPNDWIHIMDWGFPADAGTRENVWLASVAEMADRVWADDWSPNLDQVYYTVLVEDNATAIEDVVKNHSDPVLRIDAYPNPFNTQVHFVIEHRSTDQIRIKIYNNMGQLMDDISSRKVAERKYHAEWDAAGYPSGVYHCQIQLDDLRLTKSILLQK